MTLNLPKKLLIILNSITQENRAESVSIIINEYLFEKWHFCHEIGSEYLVILQMSVYFFNIGWYSCYVV